ncbi:MAG: hypothetical protein BWY49_00115 [Candidatus Omnitrophica bacterium ADurb.Bin314]|nr:MAG: hypothetical protein BWY49_00115 [Candidatus Omnitrophica bacterium ADurb.Bin314]
MLDQNADKALQTSEDSPVEHDHTVLFSVLADIVQVKALGKIHIELDRAALKRPPDRVLQMEINLGTIKSPISLINLVRQFQFVQCAPKPLRRDPPLFIGTDRFRGACRELDMIIKPEGFVHLIRIANGLRHARRELFRRRKDVGVVLRKTADPEKAGQDTRTLVAVDLPELGNLERQFAVRVLVLEIDKHPARTVHGLHRINLFIPFEKKHVLAVIVRMTRGLPKTLTQHRRGFDLDITVSVQFFPHELDQQVFENEPFGFPERKTGAFLMETEKFQLFTDLSMIPLLSLFPLLEVGIKVFLGHEGGPVNALQHGIILIAAPVSTGDREKLEGLEFAGVPEMPAFAQVRKGSVLNEIDTPAFDPFDDLQLVRLIPFPEKFTGLILIDRPLGERLIFSDNLPHPFFDLGQIFFLERNGRFKIVIESLVDHGTDRKLCSGIKV